jgi:hypothetical protein
VEAEVPGPRCAKRLASRLTKMRSGRDRWRERAQVVEGELARVQDELQQLKLSG